MNRGLRRDIVEGEAMLVLIDDLCRYFLADDLQKDVVGEHKHTFFPGDWRTRGHRRYNSRPGVPGQPSSCLDGASMAWVLGVDEAGYGPNLGPFVMSAVACRVPDALA